MIGSTRAIAVYAYAAPVDMRKSYEGLSAIVRNELQQDILAGEFYLFTNRRRTRAKVLLFDGTGLCIYMKRISKGCFAKLYGASTERRPKGKNKKQDKDKATPPSGRREQKSLPIEEVLHRLDDADCVCADCGKELCVWDGQTEDSEEIDIVARSFVLKKHRKQKYRCQCGAAPVTALCPLRLPGGGLYSIDFAIEVALSKYWLHVPLERQVRDMLRSGLDMSTSTLWDQLERLARVLGLFDWTHRRRWWRPRWAFPDDR